MCAALRSAEASSDCGQSVAVAIGGRCMRGRNETKNGGEKRGGGVRQHIAYSIQAEGRRRKTEDRSRTHLPPDGVEDAHEERVRAREDVGRVPLVLPRAHELRDVRLGLLRAVSQSATESGIGDVDVHRACTAEAWIAAIVVVVVVVVVVVGGGARALDEAEVLALRVCTSTSTSVSAPAPASPSRTCAPAVARPLGVRAWPSSRRRRRRRGCVGAGCRA